MYDYLIIGSGIAGLFTALLASRHGSVLLLTKAALEESNTRYAQGGIAAAITSEDSPELHFADTIAAGAGLCDPTAVEVLTREAPARIRDLMRVGVPFDRRDGELALGLEGAHSARRILHAGGDATGWHIEHALCAALRTAGVAISERSFVTAIVTEGRRAVGVMAQSGDDPPQLIRGQRIVLACGGAGQLFAYTTNPEVATGDGVALAYRAGAALADLEFYQFHPTALRLPGRPTFLVSEAVRGEGAYLRTIDGERFMPRYDARAELAPRDVVARAIAAEMQRGGADHVLLDLGHLDHAAMRRRFPTITAFCRDAGLDLATDPLPVAPAAHYMMGGVQTNVWGETTIPMLYAVGEVACTGVHGANRLASNSLLEGIVFGARIVEHSLRPTAEWSAEPALPAGFEPDLDLSPALPVAAVPTSAPVATDLQGLMWSAVGLVRDAAALHLADATLAAWQGALPPAATPSEHELHNEMLLGWLMAQAASVRNESRGSHYRSDAPDTDPAWRRRIVLTNPVPVNGLEVAVAGATDWSAT